MECHWEQLELVDNLWLELEYSQHQVLMECRQEMVGGLMTLYGSPWLSLFLEFFVE